MNRNDAEELAFKIATALVATEDDKATNGGVKLAAIMLAGVVAKDGRINADTFLSMCGIHKKQKTFRGQSLPTPFQRYEEGCRKREVEKT